MRTTLRRSCDSCAKSKLRCDLHLPQCSRCFKRKIDCLYANEPLSASLTDSAGTASARSSPGSEATVAKFSSSLEILLVNPGLQSFDPFDSHPQTRLPRPLVQRLIQHFLTTIAFQYYPLDLDAASNPFVTSWFPLALADPALFHVSLQTASLDVELREQNGFTNSDVLMADSVSLLRVKVQDPDLALQDETLDSVVTLAAIEFGKGNTAVSQAHIDGVKSMVRLRGGIEQVKAHSPLTARMVAWVSMIVQQSPQFATRDDLTGREGIAPPSQWHEITMRSSRATSPLYGALELSPIIDDILTRLRFLFHKPSGFDLTTTDFHDLTCFVLHTLLDDAVQPLNDTESQSSLDSEMIRYAIALFLLVVHGPTYFSHARLQYTTTLKLRALIDQWRLVPQSTHDSLWIWLLSVGMAASSGTPEYAYFTAHAHEVATIAGIHAWETVVAHHKHILWLENRVTARIFQPHWEAVWVVNTDA
ncbi:hypothetical protein BKA63DRAFT_159289 [Paraphoma chrysanthemicola]|nr:hypothetical protein BKA63DRAFT_159289 [Paraphoma chrysanthemicola]